MSEREDVIMAYKKVVFIAHCLFTVPNYVWDDTKKRWKNQYNGKPDPNEDLDGRLKMVASVIATAATEAAKLGKDATDPEVLKVFMMPECFFMGGQGSYSISLAQTAVQRLQALVHDKKWRDWIFVFGTINGVIEGDQVAANKELVNIVLIQRGGFERPELAAANCVVKQKAVFSADLLSQADMVGSGRTGDEFGFSFGMTQNEQRLLLLLRHILHDDNQKNVEAIFDKDVGKKGGWPDLKRAIDAALKDKGDAAVVRAIRLARMPAKFGEREDSWRLARTLVIKTNPALGNVPAIQVKNNPAVFQKALNNLVNAAPDAVGKALAAAKFPQEKWDEMKAFLSAVLKDKEKDGDQLEKLHSSPLCSGDEEFAQFASAGDSWSEIVKKLLYHYVAAQKEVSIYGVSKAPAQTPTTASDHDLRFASKPTVTAEEMKILLYPATGENIAPEDYLFTIDGVKKVNDKNIIFSIEICADHGTKRLKNALAAQKKHLDEKRKAGSSISPQEEVDIELITSAGMRIVSDHVVAKPDGYVFNCDGWNQGSGTIETVTFTSDGVTIQCQPHSEVRKQGSEDTFLPKRVKLDDALAANLFAKGAGQLHIYGSADL
jgi:hypothetical protein